jgi:predicted ATPase
MTTDGPGEPRGVDAPPAPDRLPFAGRESEVFRLGAAWGAATRGQPSMVLIAGEAGIGKTRLAGETVRLAGNTGGIVLRARCHKADRSVPLQPLVEAVGRLAPEASHRPAGDRAAGITGFLRGLTDRQPVLLLLDDAHNAAPATTELLRDLVGGTGTRLLVLATVRASAGEAVPVPLAAAATRIDLRPLPPAVVVRLATEAGRPDAAGDIRDRTRGHPLFLVEALRCLNDGASELPESLEAAVLPRVRRAGDHIERVLRAAAALGMIVDPPTLAALVNLSPEVAVRRCEAAVAAGLLVPTGRGYEFAHEVVREALLATTTPGSFPGDR